MPSIARNHAARSRWHKTRAATMRVTQVSDSETRGTIHSEFHQAFHGRAASITTAETLAVNPKFVNSLPARGS